jgi:hypothetical protein
MQKPEDDLRGPEHVACLKLYIISSCAGWKYDCSFVGYTSTAYKPTWYTSSFITAKLFYLFILSRIYFELIVIMEKTFMKYVLAGGT